MKTLTQFINESIVSESVDVKSIVDKVKALGPDEKIRFLYGVVYDYGKKSEILPDIMEVASILKDKNGRYYCVANIIIDEYAHKAMVNLAKKAPKGVNIKGANFFRGNTSFDETAIEYILTNLPQELRSILSDRVFVKFVSLDPAECLDYSKKYVKEIKPVKFKENIRDIDNQIRNLEKQIEDLKELKKKIEDIMV